MSSPCPPSFSQAKAACSPANEIERAIYAHSPGAPCESSIGGVAFIHRFGSALNVYIHLHACLIDGLINRTSEGLTLHPTQLDGVDIRTVSQACLEWTTRATMMPRSNSRPVALWVTIRSRLPCSAPSFLTWVASLPSVDARKG
jgi:hypothetical protein